jgi:hypothetical protein
MPSSSVLLHTLLGFSLVALSLLAVDLAETETGEFHPSEHAAPDAGVFCRHDGVGVVDARDGPR